MEQTSSAAYPNVLALRYLRETGQVVPAIELKAQEYVNLGYQRLLTFESPSGGFNWWGDEAAGNILLTGFGIQQFEDMSTVHSVDRGIIDRASAWLAKKQNSDGSWDMTSHLHGENKALGANKLRTTAYVVWSLLQANKSSAVTERAAKYIVEHSQETDDLYTLALCANALVLWNKKHQATTQLLKRIYSGRKEEGKTTYWQTEQQTAMYSRGNSATVETTALVAMAFTRAGLYPRETNQALGYLVGVKQPQGHWGSTQATVLVLKALLLAMGGVGSDADMTADVVLDGNKVATEVFNPNNSDVLRLVDLGLVEPGEHVVEIRATGPANVMYQAVCTHYEPWEEREQRQQQQPLTLKVDYSQQRLRVDDTVTAKVQVRYHRTEPTFMVIVNLGIPPGFEVLPETLQSLVSTGVIKRFSTTGRQITLYVGTMSQDSALAFSYQLRAKFPVKAKTPRSVAYEYYTPSSRGSQAPQSLTVIK